MSGGSKGGETTQKNEPWSGVQPYLQQGYAQLAQLNQSPYYNDPLVGNGQDYQLLEYPDMVAMADGAKNLLGQQGQQSGAGSTAGLAGAGTGMAGLAGLAGQLGGGAAGANSAMNQLNAAGDPANNPYFQSALQSAIRPVTQQFNEQVMPAIKQGAQGAGQMGGSRQGIAEGIAARGYQDTVGDISANMGNAAYAQGLQALQASGQLGQSMAGLQGQAYQGLGGLGSSLYGTGLQGLGQGVALSPTAMSAQLMPGQMVEDIGQSRTDVPYNRIYNYLSALNGGAGLGGTMTQSGGGSSRAMGALGGAASGAAMGSMFGPVGTGVGAVAGGLYGAFM